MRHIPLTEEELPARSKYETFVKEFLASGHPGENVGLMAGDDPTKIATALRAKIRSMKAPVELMMKGGTITLIRVVAEDAEPNGHDAPEA